MQKLKNILLIFAKMTWGIWRIFTHAFESLIIWGLTGSLSPKCIKNELKKIKEELRLVPLKSDAKFEEETTCPCKNEMRNLENFHENTQNSWN